VMVAVMVGVRRKGKRGRGGRGEGAKITVELLLGRILVGPSSPDATGTLSSNPLWHVGFMGLILGFGPWW
jgi:hypothetical protein